MQLDPSGGQDIDCSTMTYAAQPDAAIWNMYLRQAALWDIVHWPCAQNSCSSFTAHITSQASIYATIASSGIWTAQTATTHLLTATTAPVPALQQCTMPDLTKHHEMPRWRLVSFSRFANPGHLCESTTGKDRSLFEAMQLLGVDM